MSQPIPSSQPLLTHKENKSYIASQISPIQRYNIFIDCYNNKNNVVDSITLNHVPESKLYNYVYESLRGTRGKILILFLNLIPILDLVIVSIACYLTCFYWSCLKIHQINTRLVLDPCKHMIFDPELCYTLKRDYYFFNIQFKDLDGFTLNYNQQMRKQLHLRRQRGKATFMIYNANFWAHYFQFNKWKSNHIYLLLVSAVITILSNVCFFLILF